MWQAEGEACKNKTPKKIHQVWYQGAPPDDPVYNKSQHEWKRLHPSWEYNFWTQKELSAVVNNIVPQYHKFWLGMKMIEQIDFARYAMLYQEGGVYTDLDIIPVKKFDDLVALNRPIMGWEPQKHIGNAIMISPAGCEMWLELMEKIVNEYAALTNPVNNTGPVLITEWYRQSGNKQLGLVESHIFYPMTFQTCKIACTQKCVCLDPDVDFAKASKDCCFHEVNVESYCCHLWTTRWSAWTNEEVYAIIALIFLIAFVLAVAVHWY